MDTNEERYVVFSDLHGRAGLLEACYKRYGDTVTYVSGGDAIDAPEHGDVKETIGILQDIGAVCLYGNHEWVLGASMHSTDDDSRRVWTETWKGYERGVIGAYGFKSPSVFENNYDYFSVALKLKDAIQSAGHDGFFNNLKPYYETDKFIVVHGGLRADDGVWAGHGGIKQYLDSLISPITPSRHQWDEEPQMIFDRDYERSASRTTPQNLGKVLITGHNHTSEDSLSRVTDNGNRVRLAGHVSYSLPLYVYESWTGGVVPIHQ